MSDDILNNILCFPTIVYHIKKPIFFERIRNAALAALSDIKSGIDDVYPTKMSADIAQEDSIQDFCEYVAITSVNILKEQGYDVNGKAAFFESMWCQEHHKHSMMESHVHTGDIQIVGFYFLDTPEGSSFVNFHDPRAGKVQGGRLEADMANITYASNAFQMKPEAGQLILTNAWLAHSFTRQQSDKPFRFIHFNVCLTDAPKQQKCGNAAEVV